MLGFIQAGGFLMWPIVLCSVIALSISVERYWALRRSRVIPADLLNKALSISKSPDKKQLQQLAKHSPLGRILATGLANVNADIFLINDRVEEAGRHVVHDLEKYLSGLSTIAAVTPLIGLLGTVIGMIDVFSNIMLAGVGQAQALAGGIAVALLTTAAGLMVAIPTLIVHRYFQRQVENLAIDLEKQAATFVETLRKQKSQERQQAQGARDTVYMAEASA